MIPAWEILTVISGYVRVVRDMAPTSRPNPLRFYARGRVLPSTPNITVPRVGMRGWSVLRSVPLMGSGVIGWSLLMARWRDSRLIYLIIALNSARKRTDKTGQGRAGQGRVRCEMRGFLLVPSTSPTLSPIYDGLDVNVTSTITWF